MHDIAPQCRASYPRPLPVLSRQWDVSAQPMADPSSWYGWASSVLRYRRSADAGEASMSTVPYPICTWRVPQGQRARICCTESPTIRLVACNSVENQRIGSRQSCSRATREYSYSSVINPHGALPGGHRSQAQSGAAPAPVPMLHPSRACRSLAQTCSCPSCMLHVRICACVDSVAQQNPKPWLASKHRNGCRALQTLTIPL